ARPQRRPAARGRAHPERSSFPPTGCRRTPTPRRQRSRAPLRAPRGRAGARGLSQRGSRGHLPLETLRPPPNVPWVMLRLMAGVAALLGDPTRAAMLDALMDGQARPAGELARKAGVAPSTAPAHLARLAEGRPPAVA